ncbi:c2H2-type domain-containing protein [Caerostris darwini]|uniref:C2H2-type domain-containing protein n=1 Tax=Caerostris darwini TaxID=1538125 RepID=A0AAV4SDH9_9ARAC|nr:c2H2-type domain-containing protein [Caerostris darwini]
MANFQIWLEAESSSTFTFFRKLNGNLVRGNKIFHYYSCQFYNPYYQSRSTLCFRNKGVIPASLNCPVKINVCEEKGLVSATYYPIHNHHTGFHNTKYQRFKDSTRNLIKSYLLLSFPIVQIQNLIRGNVGFRGHRSFVPSKEAFISRRSIRTYYRRLQNSVHPENDALSVMCNVERLKAEEYNPILLFKPQNSKTLYGPPGLDALLNSDKSFALGIQTETQKEMLIKHSYKIICIDSTHGTNRYGFYLLSIHIQDEYGQGYPVAHFICNYLDYDTLVTLFNSLKCRISNLEVHNVMTDDDNVCYTAFNSVFGPNLNHLLCKWHVFRAWNRQLACKVHSNDLRNILRKKLKKILNEKCHSNFKTLISEFINDTSVKTHTFIQYFLDNYYNRLELWAACLRQFPHGFTDTNNYCETFHNQLKSVYFQRNAPNDAVRVLLQKWCLLLKDKSNSSSHWQITFPNHCLQKMILIVVFISVIMHIR